MSTGLVGQQDFWVVGSRFYFVRDGDANGALLDLGVIQTANPAFEPELLELEDSDGGLRTVVDDCLVKIEETYDIVCNNFTLDNLALLFLAAEPETFTQSATQKAVTHKVVIGPGKMVKIKDDDAAATWMYGLSDIIGVRKPSASTSATTSITQASREIVITGSDVTADYVAGEYLVIYGSVDTPGNDGTYEIASSSFGGGDTTITLALVNGATPLAGDEATGANIAPALAEEEDWDTISDDRGVIQFRENGLGGAAEGNDVLVIYNTAALTGRRLVKPQTGGSNIKGKAVLVWGRGNNARQTAREFQVSISPNASNMQVEDYSDFTLQAKVLSDATEQNIPAGRMLLFKGDPATAPQGTA